MKKDYSRQFSCYDWLTEYHGIDRIFFNKEKTKCKISDNRIYPYQIKDRLLNKASYDLSILMDKCLIKFSDKRMNDNNLIKALCYEKDFQDINSRPDDFYARQAEKFPWNTWMAISFFRWKTKLYNPTKHFSLIMKNNEKMICHISALTYIDIITVADNTLFGIIKNKERNTT